MNPLKCTTYNQTSSTMRIDDGYETYKITIERNESYTDVSLFHYYHGDLVIRLGGGSVSEAINDIRKGLLISSDDCLLFKTFKSFIEDNFEEPEEPYQQTFRFNDKSIAIITVIDKETVNIKSYFIRDDKLKIFDEVKGENPEIALQWVSDICRIKKPKNTDVNHDMVNFIKSAVNYARCKNG